MQEFFFLDLILLASGCKIFRPNAGVRFLNMLMTVLLLTCYSVTLLTSIESTITTGGLTILLMLERYSHELWGLTFIAVFTYYRLAMAKIMTSVSHDLTPGQKSALRRHAAACLLVVLLTTAQDAVITHLHLSSDHGSPYSLKHVTMDWLKCYHNMNNWFFGGCGVYAFFVKMIQFNEENYFDAMNSRHEQLVPQLDTKLALERRAVVRVKKYLLKTFAFIPCLWIVHVFVKAPVVLFQVAQMDISYKGRIARSLPLAYELTAIAYVVYQCDTCTQLVSKRVNDLIVGMMRENRIVGMDLFVKQLERSLEDDFSCWRTISLNRKFYFAFLCSVASFTVLIIEVTQDVTGQEGVPKLPILAMEAPTFGLNGTIAMAPFV